MAKRRKRPRVLFMSYSILDDGQTLSLPDGAVQVPNPDSFRIRASALADSLGWAVKAEGLCREDVCVPVRDRSELVHGDHVDLGAFAKLLGRPCVIDGPERVAALGTAASTRAATMASLEAPDFELPDLSGRMHTLWEHRGKKVLFIAYASW